MSSSLEFLIQIRQAADAAAAVRAFRTELQGADTDAKQAGAEIKSAGAQMKSAFDSKDFASGFVAQFEKIPAVTSRVAADVDRMGTRARVGLMGAAQAADLLGVNLSGTIMPAAQAADAIGDIAGSLAGIGPAGLAAISVVGLLAAGFLALNAVMEERNRQIAEGILETDQWVQSVRAAAGANAEVTQSLREMAEAQARVQTGWSWDPGDIAGRWMQFDTVGKGVAQMLDMLGVKASQLHPALETSAQKAERLRNELDAVYGPATQAYNAIEELRASSNHAATSAYAHAQAETQRAMQLDYAAAAARRLADALGDTRKESVDERRGDMSSLSKAKTDAAWGDKVFIPGVGWVSQSQLQSQEQAQQRWLAQQQQLMSQIRSIVESVLTPTSVEARMKRNSDAWDEWVLRLRAAMTGTNLAAVEWGAQFSAQLAEVQQRTGKTLEQLEKEFSDFSLFADKANLSLINWDAVNIDTADAIRKIVGKYNVVMQGVANFLKSPEGQALMPELKLALGLDAQATADEVKKTLGQALGGIQGQETQAKALVGVNTTEATEKINALKKAIADIPASAGGSRVVTNESFVTTEALSNIDSLKKAIAGIPASTTGSTVTTIVDVVKAATFDENFAAIMEKINQIPREIYIPVQIGEAPNAPATPPTLPKTGPGGIERTGARFTESGARRPVLPFERTSGNASQMVIQAQAVYLNGQLISGISGIAAFAAAAQVDARLNELAIDATNADGLSGAY